MLKEWTGWEMVMVGCSEMVSFIWNMRIVWRGAQRPHGGMALGFSKEREESHYVKREPCGESHDWDWRNGFSMTTFLTKPDLWLGHYWLLLEVSIPCPVFLTANAPCFLLAALCPASPHGSRWARDTEMHSCHRTELHTTTFSSGRKQL